MTLHIDFKPATWRGTTNTDGKIIGVSFDLAAGGVARLALDVGSARQLSDSIKDYLDRYEIGTNVQSLSDPVLEKLKAAGHDVDPVYGGDDYPRQGCIAAIDVQKDGYLLRVYAPDGRLLEIYMVVNTPRAAARMLEEWLGGYVPRIRGRLDHSPRKA